MEEGRSSEALEGVTKKQWGIGKQLNGSHVDQGLPPPFTPRPPPPPPGGTPKTEIDSYLPVPPSRYRRRHRGQPQVQGDSE